MHRPNKKLTCNAIIECLGMGYGKALPCTRSTADGRGTRDPPRNGPQGRQRKGPSRPCRRRTPTDRRGPRRRSRVGGERSRTFAGISSREVLALERKRRETPPGPKILDGEAEAMVIALYEGRQGYANWLLRLLAGKVVELGIADSISHETVKRTLKNGFSCKRKVQYWVIPPESDAEFVARMEQVLERETLRPGASGGLHGRTAGAARRLACRLPRIRRVDYEYERAGTAFMFCEALSFWRRATARRRRTKADWAGRRPDGRPLRELRAPLNAAEFGPAVETLVA